MYSVACALGSGFGGFYTYMDAAYHCHTDDRRVEMDTSPPFSLPSRDSQCIVEYGFDWSQLEHLSLYFNTYTFAEHYQR